MAILAGLLGGFYPALMLSGFRPAAALARQHSGKPGSGTLRTTLVVLQFAVSIGLGIAALVVFQQIEFARHMDLGFRRDNIVFTSTNALSTDGHEEPYAGAGQRPRHHRRYPLQHDCLSTATPATCCRSRSRAIRRSFHPPIPRFRRIISSSTVSRSWRARAVG